MKTIFPEYYGHNEDSYRALWQDAKFVLDTNVLLNAYRLPDEARDEFLSLLDDLKDRLWIPHQVGLEFQRRRIDVISERRKKLDELKTGIHSELGDIQSKIRKIEIEKHSVDIDITTPLEGLETCRAAVSEALANILDKYSEISHVDPVRDRIDNILDKRVGPPPENQAILDAMFDEGEDRYSNKVPPGFEDSSKSKDDGSKFAHRGLLYRAQFGDLILWKQLLEWAKESKPKSIIFVTADNKEDWWHRVSGKTIGPRPELVSEIAEVSGVNNFWMYSFSQFGKNAKTYIDAKLSEDSLKEISRVALETQRLRPIKTKNRADEFDLRIRNAFVSHKNVEELALRWASRNAWESTESHFAARVIREKDRVKAIEVKHFSNVAGASNFSRVMDSLIQADFHLEEEHLDAFQIIFVIEKLKEIPYHHVTEMVDIMRHYRETSYRGGDIEVILGDVIEGEFQPLLIVTDLSVIDFAD